MSELPRRYAAPTIDSLRAEVERLKIRAALLDSGVEMMHERIRELEAALKAVRDCSSLPEFMWDGQLVIAYAVEEQTPYRIAAAALKKEAEHAD